VEESKNMKAKAPHKLNSTLVWLNGERAAAVAMASIQARKLIDGRLYDLISHVRFLYTAEKRSDDWIIVSMNCIYEKDSLLPAVLECFANEKKHGGNRESYGALSMVLEMEGYKIADDLPGDDDPDAVERLLREKSDWLYGN
jgi:hypothetical protein